MSRLDLVVFGATGYTGKKTVEELVRIAKKNDGLSWGVAGRSQNKLDSLMLEVAKKTGEDLSTIKRIIADVSDEDSLKSMCAQAKVLVNCCGPYRLYGEPVVRAAIDSKTHYVDVTGEPQFIETMQLRYDSVARDAGVYIVNACGFDSVPNDMGVVFLEQNFNGTLNAVESYMSAEVSPQYREMARRHGTVHYGTWESLVYGVSHRGELSSLRKQLYPARLPDFKPKLCPRPLIHKHDNKWCMPFLGADNSIVYRTQRYLYEKRQKRPAQFRAYLEFPDLSSVLLIIFAGLVIAVMSSTKWTRQMLLDHPRLFSMGTVSREELNDELNDNVKCRMTLTGRGWRPGTDTDADQNETVTVQVSGTNPGYGLTVVAVLWAALTVLREQDKMPTSGGVFTTGVAFEKTNYIKNLNENNVKFQVLKTD